MDINTYIGGYVGMELLVISAKGLEVQILLATQANHVEVLSDCPVSSRKIILGSC